MSTPSPRRPGRRQGHPDEVGRAEGASRGGRPATDRARAPNGGEPLPASIVLIVGHQADAVQAALKSRPALRFALQEPQLGTGHALLQAETALAGATGRWCSCPATFLCCAARRCKRSSGGTKHQVPRPRCSPPSSTIPPGTAASSVDDGRISAIVEHKDATPEQRAIRKSTAASMRSTSHRCSARCGRSGPRTPRGSTTSPISCRSTVTRGLPVETVTR